MINSVLLTPCNYKQIRTIAIYSGCAEKLPKSYILGKVSFTEDSDLLKQNAVLKVRIIILKEELLQVKSQKSFRRIFMGWSDFTPLTVKLTSALRFFALTMSSLAVAITLFKFISKNINF